MFPGKEEHSIQRTYVRNGPAEANRQDVLVQLPSITLFYFNIQASHLSTTVVSRLKSLMLLMWAVLCSLHAGSFVRLTGRADEILFTRHMMTGNATSQISQVKCACLLLCAC